MATVPSNSNLPAAINHLLSSNGNPKIAEVAKRSGIVCTTISSVRAGSRMLPEHLIEPLAKALNADPKDLRGAWEISKSEWNAVKAARRAARPAKIRKVTKAPVPATTTGAPKIGFVSPVAVAALEAKVDALSKNINRLMSAFGL